MLAYGGLGALLYALRRNAASLVFFALACAYAARVDNIALLLGASPSWMSLAMLLCTVATVVPETFGLLYFGLLFANDAAWAATARRYPRHHPGRRHPGRSTITISSATTIWAQPFDTYLVYSILNWVVFAVAAAAITARMNP